MKNIFLASLIAICGSLSAQVDPWCDICVESNCNQPNCSQCTGCEGREMVAPETCKAYDQNCYDLKAKAERQLKKTQSTTIETTHTEQVD